MKFAWGMARIRSPFSKLQYLLEKKPRINHHQSIPEPKSSKS